MCSHQNQCRPSGVQPTGRRIAVWKVHRWSGRGLPVHPFPRCTCLLIPWAGRGSNANFSCLIRSLCCRALYQGMPSTCAGYMERYTKSLAKQAVGEYAQVAQKHGLTPTQLALAWCKSRWNVASTIIGATSLEQLKVGKVCRN